MPGSAAAGLCQLRCRYQRLQNSSLRVAEPPEAVKPAFPPRPMYNLPGRDADSRRRPQYSAVGMNLLDAKPE